MRDNLKQSTIALIAFLLSQLLLAGILAYSGHSYFHADNWRRYDSDHYLSIAERGYELYPCIEQNSATAKVYCGNTGWYPGYPYLLKLFHFVIPNTELIAGLLSKLFYFLSLYLIAKIAGINKISLQSLTLLLIAAFFFGFIYYNAVFPISVTTFLVLLSFHFYLKENLGL